MWEAGVVAEGYGSRDKVGGYAASGAADGAAGGGVDLFEEVERVVGDAGGGAPQVDKLVAGAMVPGCGELEAAVGGECGLVGGVGRGAGRDVHGEREFGNQEPEFLDMLGVDRVEGVGGVKREGGLEGLGQNTGSGVRDEDREEEGPVFVVEYEGIASCVVGVEGKETRGGAGEVGEDVNSHPVFC